VPEVSEALLRTIREGADRSAEVVLPGRPEDQVLELRSSPMRGARGEVDGAVVVVHDVTRLRRLEVVRRDFVANVSHELKTPLTAIRGLVETLLDDQDMDEGTRRRFLGKVHRQVQRLSALVADLLTLSRVESGQAAFERVPLDVRNPVRESVRALLGEAQAKSLDLQVELPMEPAMVRGDTEALRQVVDNLVSNAIKYTPERGRITLRVRQDGTATTIEVHDTGIGIAPRDRERIFERFYRVDKARSREVGGTGLGLAIVKHVVQALGGQVGVESTLGRGSTFRVTFPSADRSEHHGSPS
jgi:two-component system phosphate regulon sensor histidine kinase PhoR